MIISVRCISDNFVLDKINQRAYRSIMCNMGVLYIVRELNRSERETLKVFATYCNIFQKHFELLYSKIEEIKK